jgi:hypothetical protein
VTIVAQAQTIAWATRVRHAFPGQAGQALGGAVGLGAFDGEAHGMIPASAILPMEWPNGHLTGVA